MAILNKIRQQSLVLIFVIAMALFAFILSGLFDGSTDFSSKSQNVIATINGEDILRDDFVQKVEVAQRNFRGQGTSMQAMKRVWDQELRKAVLQTQYNNLGLVVERDKMRDLLKLSLGSYEEFKDIDGIFDEDKLNEFIANLKATSPETTLLAGSPINYQGWNNFESTIAINGLEQTYFNMVKAGIIGTLAEAELDYKLENDKVDIKFVQIPYSSIPDSLVTVTKSDIKNYINSNKTKYEVNASRDIYFVQFKEEASLEDETNIKNKLLALLEGEVDSLGKVTVVGFKNTTDNEAYVNANSAIKFNDRFLFKSLMPTELADSIFNLKKGSTYGPYKQGNYFMLSKIVEEKQMQDSIKTRHILIPFVGSTSAAPTITQNEDQAKKTADSILSVLRNNRSKFPDLVTKFSSDQGSITRGGLYDWHPELTMVEKFNDFEINKRVGSIGVVKTEFGFHIIELLDRKNKKRALKVATLAQIVEPSEETNDSIFYKATKFESLVTKQDFNSIAKENNYSVKPVSSIKALDESIPGLGNQRGIVNWAFKEDTKIGDIEKFNLPSGGGYAVVILRAINEKGLMSTEKASVRALPEIRKQKKAALIKARITATTLEDIAASESQTVKTALAVNMKSPTLSGAGREPKVIGTAFGLKENQISKLIIGNLGVYFVQTTKITPAEGLSSYQAAANRIGNTKINAINAVLFNALKDASEIEDNRATFY